MKKSGFDMYILRNKDVRNLLHCTRVTAWRTLGKVRAVHNKTPKQVVTLGELCTFLHLDVEKAGEFLFG